MNIAEQVLNNIKIRRLEAQEELRRRIEKFEKNLDYIQALDEFQQKNHDALSLLFQGRNDEFVEANRMASETFKRRKSEILMSNGYPLDYLDAVYYCSECRDSGYDCPYCIGKEKSRLYAEEIRKNSALSDNFTFDKINLDYYGEYRQPMEQVYNFCIRYCENFSLKSGNILMTGNTGLGKTHFSLAIANNVADKGCSVGYNSAVEMFMKLEDEHFQQNINDYLKMLTSIDLLVIDDLGVELENRFYVTSLNTILEIRLNRKLPTIISTNLDFDEIEERYGERILSRFMNFTILRFNGSDIRLLKRQLLIQSRNQK